MARKARKDPPAPLSVGPAAARRFLLYHQGLLSTSDRPSPWAGLTGDPGGALAAIHLLECVQIDPVNTVAPNHHLVLANRLDGYRPASLEALLDQGLLFEHFLQARCAIPREDFAYIRPRMEGLTDRRWEHVAAAAAEIMAYVRENGPASARTFTGTDKVSGYWERDDEARTKASSLALEMLWETGQLLITRREGNLRFYDLPERVMPGDLLERFASTSEDECWRALRHKYYRAYRLFDPGDLRFGWRHQRVAERRALAEQDAAAGILAPVLVEGVRRSYYVLADDVPLLEAAGTWEAGDRATLLSPLDNLLWRRERIQDLFDFSYTWEQYIPAAKRQFGPYAMPLLLGDRLVARLDPRFDRSAGALVVNRLALERGVRPSKAVARGVSQAVAHLLAFLGADTVRYNGDVPVGLRHYLE
ncbi:MAG: winged helix-turn-helix domain-containing protein [Bacillota bacterium]